MPVTSRSRCSRNHPRTLEPGQRQARCRAPSFGAPRFPTCVAAARCRPEVAPETYPRHVIVHTAAHGSAPVVNVAVDTATLSGVVSIIPVAAEPERSGALPDQTERMSRWVAENSEALAAGVQAGRAQLQCPDPGASGASIVANSPTGSHAVGLAELEQVPAGPPAWSSRAAASPVAPRRTARRPPPGDRQSEVQVTATCNHAPASRARRDPPERTLDLVTVEPDPEAVGIVPAAAIGELGGDEADQQTRRRRRTTRPRRAVASWLHPGPTLRSDAPGAVRPRPAATQPDPARADPSPPVHSPRLGALVQTWRSRRCSMALTRRRSASSAGVTSGPRVRPSRPGPDGE